MYQVFNTVKGDFPAKNVGADGEKDTVQKAHTNCHKLMNYFKEIKNCCLMRRWRVETTPAVHCAWQQFTGNKS